MSLWRAEIVAHVGDLVLDVTLEAEAGVVALVGPNGSGKTTLLRAMMGALPLTRAEIVVGDTTWENTNQDISLPVEARRLGYVPQGCGLFGHMNVMDNVAFGLSVGPNSLSRKEREARAKEALATLGCEALIKRSVRGLSGGERQRVALARALVVRPALLLLDEPTAALDAVTRREVRQSLCEHLETLGCPTLLVTHDVRDVRALDAPMHVLEAGRIVCQGTLPELQKDPPNEFIAEFTEFQSP